jgi:hypothetical protein
VLSVVAFLEVLKRDETQTNMRTLDGDNKPTLWVAITFMELVGFVIMRVGLHCVLTARRASFNFVSISGSVTPMLFVCPDVRHFSYQKGFAKRQHNGGNYSTITEQLLNSGLVQLLILGLVIERPITAQHLVLVPGE